MSLHHDNLGYYYGAPDEPRHDDLPDESDESTLARTAPEDIPCGECADCINGTLCHKCGD